MNEQLYLTNRRKPKKLDQLDQSGPRSNPNEWGSLHSTKLQDWSFFIIFTLMNVLKWHISGHSLLGRDLILLQRWSWRILQLPHPSQLGGLVWMRWFRKYKSIREMICALVFIIKSKTDSVPLSFLFLCF